MNEIAEQLQSFTDIHRLLKSYLPPVRSQKGAYTLERMSQLMEYLGNPQNSYNVIHVAGTSGKTSTCYYVASLLKQAGQKVGLSVSPHIDELNERTQVQLKPLAEKAFCKEFAIFHKQVKKSDINPTYFELLSAFAFWEFKRAGCEYAVIEVGLGGLFDATNVISSKNKLVVITDIGLDHQEVLGRTLPEIAAQKAGIIKPYNTVVAYEQASDIMEVIREVARQQHAELHEILTLKNNQLPRNLALFQRRNWYLALSAYNVLALKGGLANLDVAQLAASTETYIPARMETFELEGKTLILDGSHNQQKLEMLVKSLKHAYPTQKFVVLISFVTTKQLRLTNCLEALLPICSHLIITTFATENSEKVSVDPLKLVAICEAAGFEQWQVTPDPIEAFELLLRASGDLKLVTGSFYLLNHLRPQLKNNTQQGQ